MTVEVLPIRGVPEVRPGDDLAALLLDSIPSSGLSLLDGDVLVVTQKVVSKAEGRVVPEQPEGKRTWVARETKRVVASRGDLLIAETRHGFVCANAGVDESNVAEGFLSLLPEDPDASAEAIRSRAAAASGADVGVVITDTFGREWRNGHVDVAIGCAGVPALVDLRGTRDAVGRVLEVTVPALADQVAAAAGLVMGKADSIPAAIVRGVSRDAPWGTAGQLVRDREMNLFPYSPLQAIHARRSIRRFGEGEVSREALRDAVEAACTAPAPHHTRPWLFAVLESDVAKKRLLSAMAEAWVADLRADGTPEHVIERRLRKSDGLIGEAPVLIVPAVRLRGSHSYPDDERSSAEREMFLLSGGAAIQALLLGLHARGLGSCWVSSTLFCKEETREALGLDDEWIPLGSVAVGPLPDEEPPGRGPLPVDEHLRIL
jgi:coenzyme F420-0:L-glutamate ligase/coenzyme F420-1:gamma-L-glutamate ligase